MAAGAICRAGSQRRSVWRSAFRSIETLRDRRAPTVVEQGQSLVPPTARVPLERLQAALGDYDLSAASTALADLDLVAMSGAAAGELARLRQHVDGYEYEEARALATRLLAQIGRPPVNPPVNEVS